MDEKETRRSFFESDHGLKLLRQLESHRTADAKGIYGVSGQFFFEDALEREMNAYREVSKGHGKALRKAGYQDDFEGMSAKELAEFIGSEGFEFLIDREEGETET